jgi:hypothetical protein
LEAAPSESVADINKLSVVRGYALRPLKLSVKHKLRSHEASGKYRFKFCHVTKFAGHPELKYEYNLKRK